MTVVTRPLEYRDVDAVCGLLVELFTRGANSRPDLFRSPRPTNSRERAQLERYVKDRLNASAERLIVAEEDGTVLGFVQVLVEQVPEAPSVPYRRAVKEGWILNVAVGAQYRRRGVGRVLDNAARAWARSRGAETMGLQVWAYNHEAAAFFARLGYEPRATRLYGPC